MPEQQPVIEFFKLLQDGKPPKRAERTAAGILPSRALRYCDALTTATGFGYWLFPPADLQLLWSDSGISWAHAGSDMFYPVSDTSTGAVQYPDFEAKFDASVPASLAGYSIPYLTAGLEPGSVQMWTGLLARTKPGWSLSIRQPVNLIRPQGLTFFEGIIEADQWFGPLFTVIQIQKTDVPFRLRAHIPFLQVQPIPQAAYQEALLNSHRTSGFNDMVEEDWEQLRSIIAPQGQDGRPGGYAVSVRKRRSCPYHGEVVARALDKVAG